MVRSPSLSNQNNVQRRQLHTIRERERRRSMTEEQRQNYLNQRRSYYQRRQTHSLIQTDGNSTDMNSSDAASNHREEQLRQRRIADRNRRQSMTEEQRSNHLARRREYYRRRRYPHLLSSTTDAFDISNTNIVAQSMMDVESLPNTYQIRADTVVRQMCHTEPIRWNTFSSNFERGGTSAPHLTNSYRPA